MWITLDNEDFQNLSSNNEILWLSAEKAAEHENCSVGGITQGYIESRYRRIIGTCPNGKSIYLYAVKRYPIKYAIFKPYVLKDNGQAEGDYVLENGKTVPPLMLGLDLRQLAIKLAERDLEDLTGNQNIKVLFVCKNDSNLFKSIVDLKVETHFTVR